MKKTFQLLLLLLVVQLGYSQLNTNSPYSRYGIGIERPLRSTNQLGLAGTSIGVRSSLYINYDNPAALSAMKLTAFEFGGSFEGYKLTSDAQEQTGSRGYLNHMAFAFPVMKDTWGMSFGVLPRTTTGYAYYYEEEKENIGKIDYLSEGSGGLNTVFLGNGLGMYLDSAKTSYLSIGGNVEFVFGEMNHDSRTLIEDASALNMFTSQKESVSDFNFNVSTQFTRVIKKEGKDPLHLTVGATFQQQNSLVSKGSRLGVTHQGIYVAGANLNDTVLFYDDKVSTVQLPSRVGLGFSLSKPNHWMVAADYKMYSQLLQGNVAGESMAQLSTLKSYNEMSLGGWYIPEYDAFSNYLRMISYQLGVKYKQTGVHIGGQDIDEYGMTFGVLLPTRRSATAIAKLGLGVEYLQRGTLKNNLVKEDYILFNMSVTINDNWFIKRKYD